MSEALAVEDFPAWDDQVSAAGACSHPIRLTGKVQAVNLVTGETAEVFRTWTDVTYIDGKGELDTWRDDQPLHVACGNRREAVCPSCSAIYKRDARHLVRAGLTGGKGVPETVAAHPCVFATVTAPSFGPVHARRERGGKVLPCRPRRDRNRRVCPHGRDISCPLRHGEDDPRLGRPMCPECYDYRAAVLFNAVAGKLWQRFETFLPRHLARLGGVTGTRFGQLVKVRFVKVAEYQLRGVVHFHAIIRLDANTKDGYAPPPPGWTADLLCAAIKLAARQASALAPVAGTGRALLLRFGTQTDTRIVRGHQGDELTPDAVANYIAKYATKTADAPGLPSSRIRSAAEVQALRCPAHHRRMIETAWQLGHRKWAHMLGYGGHFLTKSRRYSVTFGQLRAARAAYRRAQRYEAGQLDPWGRPVDETTVLFLGSWTYAGSGYIASDGQLLALMSADSARER
jgi:hypothetical protein